MAETTSENHVGKARLHLPRLIQRHHLHGKVHGEGWYGRFNAKLAVWVTQKVGTMTCAYLFTIIALIGLPTSIDQMRTQGALPLVQWIAQTFLQLVLLSVIMVGQRVIGAAQDARAEADHETLSALHVLTKQVSQLTAENTLVLRKLGELSSHEGSSTSVGSAGPIGAADRRPS